MVNQKIIETVREMVSNAPERKFKETVELAINLRFLDLTDPKKRVSEEIILPNGRGRPVKVAVFASGETASKAKNVADAVIMPEEIDKLAENKRTARKFAETYDFYLAEAALMTKIGKVLGVVLGPRGKMPRVIPVGSDPTSIIKNLRETVRARSKERRTFHVPVGTRDMPPEKIAENIEEVLKKITAKLEKGDYNIESMYVKTTMGPALKLEVK